MFTERFGFLFRCIVTNANGDTLTSNVATLTECKTFTVNEVTYEILNDRTLRVVSYEGTSSSIVINETVNGMTVTEIGEEAFINKTNLVSIDLPDTINIIRARAFKGCTGLREMK